MANNLSLEKKIQILNMLCEGVSMRAISRLVGCSINTVNSLLVNIGKKCDEYHYFNIRNVKSTHVQVDEIWAFCYAKNKNVSKIKANVNNVGDVWTWTAICPDTKLVISWHTGERGISSAKFFLSDLHSRLHNRIQLTSDGHYAYLKPMDAIFATNVDFAMLVKNYTDEKLDIQKTVIIGNPDPQTISTSMVERQNLSMRMSMRRFTRKTNAHSKKLANHKHALSLYFMYFNFIRHHSGLKSTPAIKAGLTDHQWTWAEVLALKANGNQL